MDKKTKLPHEGAAHRDDVLEVDDNTEPTDTEGHYKGPGSGDVSLPGTGGDFSPRTPSSGGEFIDDNDVQGHNIIDHGPGTGGDFSPRTPSSGGELIDIDDVEGHSV
jgi:hypothetical protein